MLNRKYHSIILLFWAVTVFSAYGAESLVLLPSDVGGDKGLVLQINTPTESRYLDGAPVVVIVVGGFDDNGLPIVKESNFIQDGFIEVHFSWPGLPKEPSVYQSGGTYDYRGPNCIQALRDVLLFAEGKKLDNTGKALSDFTGSIQPMYDHVGLVGFSNGGNATLTTVGIYGDTLDGLAWMVHYESPVGDGMPGAEYGSNNMTSGENPLVNSAYDTLTSEWDLSALSYCDTLNISGSHLDNPENVLQGGFYFDFDADSVVDQGDDFVLYPIKVISSETNALKAYYSDRIRSAADSLGILPDSIPDHLASLEETEEFWFWRNGESYISTIANRFPDLLFLVYAFDEDHVQSAPDKPHVRIQYQEFLDAGSPCVRLNPDRSYVEMLTGRPEPLIKDNPANVPMDEIIIRSATNPNRAVQMTLITQASVCEMADRYQWQVYTPQLSAVLTNVESIDQPDQEFRLLTNYPNPFNPVTQIHVTIEQTQLITLSIYNLLGQEVAVLEDKVLAEGTHIYPFDGSRLASGYYYCKLKTSQKSIIRKMTLLK